MTNILLRREYMKLKISYKWASSVERTINNANQTLHAGQCWDTHGNINCNAKVGKIYILMLTKHTFEQQRKIIQI